VAGVARSYTLECNYNSGRTLTNHVPPVAAAAATTAGTTAAAGAAATTSVAKTPAAQAKHNSAVLGAKSAAAASARQGRSAVSSNSKNSSVAEVTTSERGGVSPERQPCRPPLYGPDEWREVGRAFLVSLLVSRLSLIHPLKRVDAVDARCEPIAPVSLSNCLSTTGTSNVVACTAAATSDCSGH
jgi:hypothetical protein